MDATPIVSFKGELKRCIVVYMFKKLLIKNELHQRNILVKQSLQILQKKTHPPFMPMAQLFRIDQIPSSTIHTLKQKYLILVSKQLQ